MKLDEVVGKYIKLRDMKTQIKREYDAKVGKVEAAMDKIEAMILKFFDENGGIQSIRTTHGTPYVQLRESVTVADRDSFFDFIRANERWDMLESRANKTAVLQHKEEHEGELPPGLNYRAERVINIKRG
jgi:hypothetical protein